MSDSLHMLSLSPGHIQVDDPASGSIPREWLSRSLDDVAEIVMGQSPPGTTYNQSGHGAPLINGPTEFGKRYPEKLQWTTAPAKLCRPGGVLFCVRGSTTGRINVADDTFCIGRGVAAIRGKPGLAHTSFIELFLMRLAEDVLSEARGSGSTFPSINSKRLATTRLVVPPYQEQERIAIILDTVEASIDQTEALIAKLKQMKAGLLHDLLTRGLDEHGQLRDPVAHPERFKDSPLGPLPCQWEINPLRAVAVKIQDGTHFSPQATTGPCRYLTSKNVRFGYLDLEDCGWISQQEHNAIYARCDVRFGDVLLTKDGANTGNAAINDIREPFSLLSSVAFIRCDGVRCHAGYVLQYLLSPIGQRRLKDLMSGNAITRLTLQKIKAFTLPLPPSDEQKQIAAILDVLDARIRAEEAYRDKLKLLKKGLMDDLLTGRVRVAAAMEAVP